MLRVDDLERLSRWRAGELPPAEADEVRARVESDEAWAAAARRLAALDDGLASLRNELLLVDWPTTARVSASIARAVPDGRPIRVLVALAAALCIFVAGWLLGRQSEPPPPAPVAERQPPPTEAIEPQPPSPPQEARAPEPPAPTPAPPAPLRQVAAPSPATPRSVPVVVDQLPVGVGKNGPALRAAANQLVRDAMPLLRACLGTPGEGIESVPLVFGLSFDHQGKGTSVKVSGTHLVGADPSVDACLTTALATPAPHAVPSGHWPLTLTMKVFAFDGAWLFTGRTDEPDPSSLPSKSPSAALTTGPADAPVHVAIYLDPLHAPATTIAAIHALRAEGKVRLSVLPVTQSEREGAAGRLLLAAGDRAWDVLDRIPALQPKSVADVRNLLLGASLDPFDAERRAEAPAARAAYAASVRAAASAGAINLPALSVNGSPIQGFSQRALDQLLSAAK